jgi:hypothetical protein
MNQPVQKIGKAGTSVFVQFAIVLLGLVGGYIYYSQVIKPAKVPIVLRDIPKGDSLEKFKTFDSFDFSVLDNSSFKGLKILGDIPVDPGVTGRTDLFAPF